MLSKFCLVSIIRMSYSLLGHESGSIETGAKNSPKSEGYLFRRSSIMNDDPICPIKGRAARICAFLELQGRKSTGTVMVQILIQGAFTASTIEYIRCSPGSPKFYFVTDRPCE